MWLDFLFNKSIQNIGVDNQRKKRRKGGKWAYVSFIPKSFPLQKKDGNYELS